MKQKKNPKSTVNGRKIKKKNWKTNLAQVQEWGWGSDRL